MNTKFKNKPSIDISEKYLEFIENYHFPFSIIKK